MTTQRQVRKAFWKAARNGEFQGRHVTARTSWTGYCNRPHPDSAAIKPAPSSEIIIERDSFYHRWVMYFSAQGRCAILDEWDREFPDFVDPMVVARSLKARAAGAINVVVNL